MHGFLKVLVLCAAALCCLPALGSTPAGRIVLAGDEWAFSDDGYSHNSVYITNVLGWFGLTSGGAGKKVLVLDGQSWNCGFNSTCGAFGSMFRSRLAAMGVTCTYVGYTDEIPPLAGFQAVFAAGLMTKGTTFREDLLNYVASGGSVYIAGGTGTFSPASPLGEAQYWQPFLSAATGPNGLTLAGGDNWIAQSPPLNFAGPVGGGVTNLDWYMGQGVLVGSSANASAAVWDSNRILVATWSSATLSIARDNAGVVLKWDGTQVLQTSTNPFSGFEDILSATSPFTNDIAAPFRFFRLR